MTILKQIFKARDEDLESVDSSDNSPSVLGSPPADMSFDSTDLPLYNNVSNDLPVDYYLHLYNNVSNDLLVDNNLPLHNNVSNDLPVDNYLRTILASPL